MLSRVSRRVLTRAVRPAIAASVDVSQLDSRAPTPVRLFAFKETSPLPAHAASLRFDGSLNRLQAIRLELHRAFCDENLRETVARAADVPTEVGLAALLEPLASLPADEVRQTYEFDRPAVIPTTSYAQLGQSLYGASTLRAAWHPEAGAFHAVAVACSC
ncbi:hypothetical protein ACHHYP_20323 [Achlya hypogyna]|uniref:Uncharacterized protein n=1 Tax=Achlya hypogyna TaxID=1202772 RepID=A0A1V9ZM55_ACHHY|nr:hypothetical protein ACHHYP_20323 [Achlya hypogyna]